MVGDSDLESEKSWSGRMVVEESRLSIILKVGCKVGSVSLDLQIGFSSSWAIFFHSKIH
jgi:hypothetical protein